MTTTPTTASWKDSYDVRRSVQAPEITLVTIAGNKFQLWDNELEHLRNLLNAAAPVVAEGLGIPAHWQDRAKWIVNGANLKADERGRLAVMLLRTLLVAKPVAPAVVAEGLMSPERVEALLLEHGGFEESRWGPENPLQYHTGKPGAFNLVRAVEREVLAAHPVAGSPAEADWRWTHKGKSPFPERDQTKPAEQQGMFRKFDVRRTDGSDQPGGKHYGCRYYVLDLTHDQHAPAAMRAYASSCAATHPQLAADIVAEFGEPMPASEAMNVKVDKQLREAVRLAEILRGMCEGGRVEAGTDIYAESYQADDGDVFVVRAADLLEDLGTQNDFLVRALHNLAAPAAPTDAKPTTIQRQAVFAAFSECLTAESMLPQEIADKLIAAANTAAQSVRDAAQPDDVPERLVNLEDSLKTALAEADEFERDLDAALKAYPPTAPEEVRDTERLNWLGGENCVAMNQYVAVYDDSGTALETPRKIFVIELESQIATVEGATIREAVDAAIATTTTKQGE